MEKTLVYLVGEPGAGKSTALREAFAGYTRTEVRVGACPMMALVRSFWSGRGLPARAHELGRDRPGGFGGTDALSMSIAPRALEAMGVADGLIVAEGDRLAHNRFLSGCSGLGWRVRVLALTTPPYMAAGRRAGRGGGQNEAWVKGRRTKAVRLARLWQATPIDGTGTPEETGSLLREQIVAALS